MIPTKFDLQNVLESTTLYKNSKLVYCSERSLVALLYSVLGTRNRSGAFCLIKYCHLSYECEVLHQCSLDLLILKTIAGLSQTMPRLKQPEEGICDRIVSSSDECDTTGTKLVIAQKEQQFKRRSLMPAVTQRTRISVCTAHSARRLNTAKPTFHCKT